MLRFLYSFIYHIDDFLANYDFFSGNIGYVFVIVPLLILWIFYYEVCFPSLPIFTVKICTDTHIYIYIFKKNATTIHLIQKFHSISDFHMRELNFPYTASSSPMYGMFTLYISDKTNFVVVVKPLYFHRFDLLSRIAFQIPNKHSDYYKNLRNSPKRKEERYQKYVEETEVMMGKCFFPLRARSVRFLDLASCWKNKSF